jgi:hypothetical protein
VLFDFEQLLLLPIEQTRAQGESIISLMRDDLTSNRPGYCFYLDVFGGWRWEYFDCYGDAVDSRESFETREECVENAGATGLSGTVLVMPARQASPARADHDRQQSTREQQTKRAA